MSDFLIKMCLNEKFNATKITFAECGPLLLSGKSFMAIINMTYSCHVMFAMIFMERERI